MARTASSYIVYYGFEMIHRDTYFKFRLRYTYSYKNTKMHADIIIYKMLHRRMTKIVKYEVYSPYHKICIIALNIQSKI